MTVHYHGTPITPRAQLLRMAGRNFCVSYAAPNDLRVCLQIGQSVMLDNGAFSVWTKGIAFDVPGFYAWVAPVLGHPHWAVIPDVIGGDEQQQRQMLKTWPFPRALGAPVWHLDKPIDYLLYLADEYPRICLGSAGEYWQVGDARWCRRMDEAFNALAKRGALPWIHGLRMLGQIGEWPLASADSTNVAQNHHLYGCAECMAANIDVTQGPSKWKQRAEQQPLFS